MGLSQGRAAYTSSRNKMFGAPLKLCLGFANLNYFCNKDTVWQTLLFLHFLPAIPIGVKFCVMVHIGSGHKVSPFRGGRLPSGNPKIPKFGPVKTEYLQNGKSQCYIIIIIIKKVKIIVRA